MFWAQFLKGSLASLCSFLFATVALCGEKRVASSDVNVSSHGNNENAVWKRRQAWTKPGPKLRLPVPRSPFPKSHHLSKLVFLNK